MVIEPASKEGGWEEGSSEIVLPTFARVPVSVITQFCHKAVTYCARKEFQPTRGSTSSCCLRAPSEQGGGEPGPPGPPGPPGSCECGGGAVVALGETGPAATLNYSEPAPPKLVLPPDDPPTPTFAPSKASAPFSRQFFCLGLEWHEVPGFLWLGPDVVFEKRCGRRTSPLPIQTRPTAPTGPTAAFSDPKVRACAADLYSSSSLAFCNISQALAVQSSGWVQSAS